MSLRCSGEGRKQRASGYTASSESSWLRFEPVWGPHPEEPRAARRLEGWPHTLRHVAILRDGASRLLRMRSAKIGSRSAITETELMAETVLEDKIRVLAADGVLTPRPATPFTSHEIAAGGRVVAGGSGVVGG